jgi:hypothetical protein
LLEPPASGTMVRFAHVVFLCVAVGRGLTFIATFACDAGTGCITLDRSLVNRELLPGHAAATYLKTVFNKDLSRFAAGHGSKTL